MAKLTTRTLASGVTSSDLIHIVIPSDLSQDPAGSSYKASIQQVFDAYPYVTITGGTYNGGTGTITITNNTGGTVSITGVTSGGGSVFTGGTVNGPTNFTNGLTANTISATTYYNLPGSSSGNCLVDFYVSNIHSCSPLNINPLDEGDVFFGSNSGVTIDLANGGNMLVKGSVIAQSDSASLSTISTLSATEGLKGQITYFSHTGGTANLLYNPNTSGYTQIAVGANTSQNKDIQLAYYGSDYLRTGSPISGNNFYQNKGVLKVGLSTSGIIINISPTGSTGNLWFEQNGNSIMYLKGSGSQGLLGIGLNPNGTEVPTSNLQIGGTGTTGTIKYRDGNQQNGYVLTSDSAGNATWQPSSGGGSSINSFNDLGNVSTIAWNVSGVSTNYEATLTATTTLNLTNVRNGDYGTIIIKQDVVGGRTLTLGTVNGSVGTHRVANGGGGVIILTSNASATDILTFTYNGSTMYWTVGNDYT